MNVLIIEDSLRNAINIATELRLAGHIVTCISGVHELHECGVIVPCTEYGVGAMRRDFYRQQSVRLNDFAVVLLDFSPDGMFTGKELLERLQPSSDRSLPAFIGISDEPKNNDLMVRLGACVGFHKTDVNQIVAAVERLARERVETCS